MRTHRNAFFLSLLLVSGLLAACAEQKEPLGSPHPLGKAWLIEGTGFHGDSFEQGLLNCAECHNIQSFCTQCHFDPNQPDVRVPPGSGWVHKAPPPSHADLTQYGAICNKCHDLLRGYGAGPAPCHDCHGSASPHPEGWVDPTNPNFHGPSAEADLDSCRVCHGDDLMGGSVGVSCYQCHFGPDGTKQPADVSPNDWAHDDAKIRHAEAGLFTAEDQAVCVQCHGLMNGFTGSPTFTDCTTASCHPGSLADSYHGADFFTDHPPAAKADLATCATCHNTPTPPPNFDGYVTGLACVACHDQGIAHPPGPAGVDWYVDHRTSGNRATACAICHDVQQGRTPPLDTAPSCFSTDFNGQGCHPGGPGTAPHPVDGSYLSPTLHGADAKGDPGMVFCQGCHASPASGRSPAPRFNVPIGNLPAGCETCHADLTAHPSLTGRDHFHWYGSFVTHKDAQNLTVSCALCHGANLEGDVGPACTACHTAGSPVTLAGCSSCHATPPDSQPSDTKPNRQGAHDTHNALTDVTGVCTTCHNGGGTGTDNHFNDQQEPFLSILSTPGAYKAETAAAGTPKFTVSDTDTGDGTCAGVSCHGGQETPHWLTETIDVSTDCTKCHIAETTRTQYNSAVSGEHDEHVNQLHIACTACHNANVLDPALNPASTHFTALKTTAMEGPASATIGGEGTAVTAYDANQNCTSVCHGTRPWGGD